MAITKYVPSYHVPIFINCLFLLDLRRMIHSTNTISMHIHRRTVGSYTMPTFAIFTHYIQNELIHHVTCCPRPYSHSSRLSSLHRLVCRCRAMATTKVWNFTGSQSWNWSWRWAWHQLTCVIRFSEIKLFENFLMKLFELSCEIRFQAWPRSRVSTKMHKFRSHILKVSTLLRCPSEQPILH